MSKKITGKIYPLVLVLDPYYFANAPYVRGIISDELEKGDPAVKDFSWQIVDTRGFESLCALGRHEDLISLVATKFSSAELQTHEMETFVDNYISAKQIERSTLAHPVFITELNGFQEEIESRYGVKFKSVAGG